METLQIIKQLLNGNHLSQNEMNEAKNLVFKLDTELKSRENLTLYKKRIELNQFEIIGIEKYLKDSFDYDDFIYSDLALHFDIGNSRFAAFKISKNDLYIGLFPDDSENRFFRLNLGTDTFSEINNNFDFIQEVNDLRNLK